MIERYGREHVAQMAALHARRLTGLLADLGPRAVRAFYIGALASPHAVGLVHLRDQAVRGMIFGSVRPGELRRQALDANLLGTLAGLAQGVVRRPRLLRSLWASTRRPHEGYDARAAELTYLAVAAEERGAGIGAELVGAFNAALSERGVTSYELSVDCDNTGAIRFYERIGFRQVGEYDEFKIRHMRYRLDLVRSDRAGPTSRSPGAA